MADIMSPDYKPSAPAKTRSRDIMSPDYQTGSGAIPENQQFSMKRFFGGDPTYWEGVGHRGAAQARTAVRGFTFGTIDKLASAINADPNAGPDAMRKQREADRATLGEAQTNAIDFAGSLVNPLTVATVMKPAAGPLATGLGFGAEGAAKSGLSSWSKDNTPAEIAMDAGVGGVLSGLAGAVAAPFSRWLSGGTKAPPAPPPPKTLQEVFAPTPPPPSSPVPGVLDKVANMPAAVKYPVDVLTAHAWGVPVASTVERAAKTANYLTKGPDGRLLVNPEAARAAREALAQLTMSGSAQLPAQYLPDRR